MLYGIELNAVPPQHTPARIRVNKVWNHTHTHITVDRARADMRQEEMRQEEIILLHDDV